VKPYYDYSGITLYHGDCRRALAALPAESVNCCVTSPPYFGLRDYGVSGQIGLEQTPDAYVAEMVTVFREVRRVLSDDGTLWLNLGDSYAGNGKGGNPENSPHKMQRSNAGAMSMVGTPTHGRKETFGLKRKDLIGIPWRVAFALQADGWCLRSDIIWHKPNPMPESVTDRPTRAHEYIFLLSKSDRYSYDAEAIKEPGSGVSGGACFGKVNLDAPNARRVSAEENARIRGTDKQRGHGRRHDGFNDRWDAMEKSEQVAGKVNKRDVWSVAPANFPGAHFATFPPKLIEPCIKAGCPAGGVVLDPFNGSGTTGQVARDNGCAYIGIELNEEYIALTLERLAQGVLFNGPSYAKGEK
jgi:DNA modification methylase